MAKRRKPKPRMAKRKSESKAKRKPPEREQAPLTPPVPAPPLPRKNAVPFLMLERGLTPEEVEAVRAAWPDWHDRFANMDPDPLRAHAARALAAWTPAFSRVESFVAIRVPGDSDVLVEKRERDRQPLWAFVHRGRTLWIDIPKRDDSGWEIASGPAADLSPAPLQYESSSAFETLIASAKEAPLEASRFGDGRWQAEYEDDGGSEFSNWSIRIIMTLDLPRARVEAEWYRTFDVYW